VNAGSAVDPMPPSPMTPSISTSSSHPPVSSSNPTSNELQHLAHQVSGFFGSLFKEVKTLSNDVGEKVEGFVTRLSTQPPPGSSSSTSRSYPPSSSGSTSPSHPGQPASRSGRQEQVSRAQQEAAALKAEEDFEMQLALAMSLSLQESQKPGALDPETVKELENEGIKVEDLLQFEEEAVKGEESAAKETVEKNEKETDSVEHKGI
jgi:hypothetical protein